MAEKMTLLEARPENPQEAAQREWFEKQALAAPDNLEAAARLLIGLSTTLLGVLFGVLAIAKPPLPSYLNLPALRALGMLDVAALLVGLLAALDVVMPWRETAASGQPTTQQAAFERLLRRKARALTVAVLAFGVGIVGLGIVLWIALALAA